jgi:hypothetical protein
MSDKTDLVDVLIHLTGFSEEMIDNVIEAIEEDQDYSLLLNCLHRIDGLHINTLISLSAYIVSTLVEAGIDEDKIMKALDEKAKLLKKEVRKSVSKESEDDTTEETTNELTILVN